MSFPFMVGADVVARALSISRTSVYDFVNDNTLPFPAHRIGQQYRFRRVDVEEYLGASLDEVLA